MFYSCSHGNRARAQVEIALQRGASQDLSGKWEVEGTAFVVTGDLPRNPLQSLYRGGVQLPGT